MPDDSIWEEEENRETRMPKVDGVPITEGLSERGSSPGTQAGWERPVEKSLATPRSESPSTIEPDYPLGRARATPDVAVGESAGSSAAQQVGDLERAASGCTYDPLPGMKCPACGKLHKRQGRSVKIHVPAGDVRTDFK